MFGKYSAIELVKKFSSPLYVYDEKVLRKSCQKIKQLCNLKNFQIHYAVKANSNIALLKIIRSEGLQAEVISIPELKLAQMAGWKKEEILFSGNNITEEDLKFYPACKINFLMSFPLMALIRIQALSPPSAK